MTNNSNISNENWIEKIKDIFKEIDVKNEQTNY